MQGRAVRCRTRRSLSTVTRPGRPTSSGCPCVTRGPRTIAGDAIVVYGHTPVPEAVWVNKTICLDTGCVFGGMLTALRYPERELVSVTGPRRSTTSRFARSSQSPPVADDWSRTLESLTSLT